MSCHITSEDPKPTLDAVLWPSRVSFFSAELNTALFQTG